jgi:hypothetical protein
MQREPRERFAFQGRTNLFYKRIEPEHFALNAVLYELKQNGAKRHQLLADPAAFATTHGVDPAAMQALYDNDIAALVERGGHPIIGWTVILLLRFERGDTTAHAPPGAQP